jgi:hypothetical protein
MGRVTAVVQRGQTGDRATARQELAALWAEVEQRGGDAFHRCVIAHFLADLQDDLADGVTDERAQEYHPSLQVRGFLPSLYLSLADDHRRLGDAERAHGFLRLAEGTIDALGDDAYGALVRSGLENVARALAEGSTERLLSH